MIRRLTPSGSPRTQKESHRERNPNWPSRLPRPPLSQTPTHEPPIHHDGGPRDIAARITGQQQGRPIQMLELLCDQSQIHSGEIGTCAAGVEVNPLRRIRGTGSPVAIPTQKCADLGSTGESGHRLAIGRSKTATGRNSTGGRLCGRWRAQHDSNVRPPGPQPDALSN